MPQPSRRQPKPDHVQQLLVGRSRSAGNPDGLFFGGAHSAFWHWLSALIVPLLGQPLLLLPIHLVVLELLLHPIVSLVFQADPASSDVMNRPPRQVGKALSLRALAPAYTVGTVLAAVVIAIYLVALANWSDDRALAFSTLLASQPLLLLSMRSPERPLWSTGQPRTRAVVAAAATTAWREPFKHLRVETTE